MKIRIITAIVAILIFFPLVFMNGLPFQIAMYIIATIGLLELLHMRKTTSYPIPTILTVILLWGGLLFQGEFIFFSTRTELLMFFVLLLLAYTVLVKNKFTFEDAGFLILSTIYVGLGFYYFIQTRDVDNDGLVYIFYAILVILQRTRERIFLEGHLEGESYGQKSVLIKQSRVPLVGY